jgi:hypothetical protein
LEDTHRMLTEIRESQKHAENKRQEELSELRKAVIKATEIEKALQINDEVDQELLECLRFSTMKHRREEISEAHQQTCQWIFRESQSKYQDRPIRQQSNFVEWLRTDGEVYWINGKAGSGKSTLMRYINDSQETYTHMQVWAGRAEIQVASFYFWNGGSLDQRSQAGLLKCLLYEILQCRRNLIRRLFPDEWLQYRSFVTARRRPDSQLPLRKLKAAFIRLSNIVGPQLKICLFVDGLDECEEGLEGLDHESLIELFLAVAASPYIKVCLSSRPWIVFEDSFQSAPSFRMQDLTCSDIRNYTRDKIELDTRMQQLIMREPRIAAGLVEEIVTKANGVFLWVRMVVQSLLRGLRNGDDLSTLRKRVECLPSDLEDLYRHLFRRVDSIYRSHMSQIFQVFGAALRRNERVTVLELEIATSTTFVQVLKSEQDTMSKQEVDKRVQQMTTLLKSRCEGLLEVHDILDLDWESTDGKARRVVPIHLESRAEWNMLRVGWIVTYLHRAVRDFLHTEAVQAELSRLAPCDLHFDPNLSMLVYYVTSFKRSVISHCSFYEDARFSVSKNVWATTKVALLYAKDAGQKTEPIRTALLTELYTIGQLLWQSSLSPPESESSDVEGDAIEQEWQRLFLFAAVSLRFTCFVNQQLKLIKTWPRSREGKSLLTYAVGLLTVKPPSKLPELPECPKMVEVLLRHGADPNEKWNCMGPQPKMPLKPREETHGTLWEHVLESMHIRAEFQRDCQQCDVLRWAFIFESMLLHGADPSATCAGQGRTCSRARNNGMGHSVRDIIEGLFKTRVPELAVGLLRILEERQHLVNHPAGTPYLTMKRSLEQNEAGKVSKKRARILGLTTGLGNMAMGH